MKAWQFTGTHQPLALHDVPDPVPGAGEVVVTIEAAGMCHSDVGVLESENFVPFPLPVPVTLGHEIAGVVTAVGSEGGPWPLGSRVAVYLGANPVGFARDGGYAHQVLVDETDLVAIPDGVSFEHAAVATDAGATAYLAVKTRGQVEAGDRVGIIGYGGLGQLGAQIAIALGAEVFVAEPKETARPDALAAGARGAAASISEFSQTEFDVIIDFAGFGTTADAILALRPGGRVVQVGLGKQLAAIDIWALVSNNITVTGALGAAQDDLIGVLDLFAAGKLSPRISPVDFEDVPAALERLASGETDGRSVIRP